MRQRSMRWLLAVACVASGAGSAAFAETAATQVTVPAATRPEGEAPRPDNLPVRPRWWLTRDNAPLPEEWTDITAFMAQNNPVRLEMLKRIEESLGGLDSTIATQIRRTLTRRYRDLETLKARNSELYTFALTRLQLEDNILGAFRDLKAPDAKKDELNAKLNEKIRASVDNGLAERRVRIEQLTAALEKEKAALVKDTAEIDRLVQAQRKKFEDEMNAMLDFDAQNSPATTQANEAK